MCHNEKYGKFNIKMHMHSQNRITWTMNNVIFKKQYKIWQVIMKLKYTTSYTTITKG
jgi:hypothetical protein